MSKKVDLVGKRRTAPNAVIRLETPKDSTSGREERSAFAFDDFKTETESSFEASVAINPVAFKDAQTLSNALGVNFSTGTAWAGQWRLLDSQAVPSWVVDALPCSVKLRASNHQPEGKSMTGLFYWSPYRDEFGDRWNLGPEIILHLNRFN